MRSRALLLLLAGLVVIGATSPAMGQYTLTVVDGTGAAGPHAADTNVPITATVAEGLGFAFWTGDIAGVGNVNAASTYISMPAADATVTAVSVPLTPNFIRLREGGASPGQGEEGLGYVDTPVDDISLQFRDKTQQYGTLSSGPGNVETNWFPATTSQLDQALDYTDFGTDHGGVVLLGYGEMFDANRVPRYKPGHDGDANYAVKISKAELALTSWSGYTGYGQELTAFRMLTPWMLGDAGTNEYRIFSDCIDTDLDGVGDLEWVTNPDTFPTMNASTTGAAPWGPANSKNSFGAMDYDANTGSSIMWIPHHTMLGYNLIDVTDIVRAMYTTGDNQGFCMKVTYIAPGAEDTTLEGHALTIPWCSSEFIRNFPAQGRPELRIQYSWPDEPGVPVELTVLNGSGGGWTSVGIAVDLSADPPPGTDYFYDWVGDVANVANTNALNTTITMGASAATITATYGPGYSIRRINAVAGMPDLVRDGAVGSLVPIYLGPTNIGIDTFDQYVGDSQHLLNRFDPTTSAIIPAYDITVTATYGLAISLDVSGGTGSGTYAIGRSVPIAVSQPMATGYLFKEWTGDVNSLDDPYSATTDATLPEDDISVTAILDLAQILTVVSGQSDVLPEFGVSTFVLGGVAVIVADIPPQDMVFSHWTGDTANIANVNASPTTITMNADYTVTANYVNDSIDDADMVYKTVLKDAEFKNNGIGYPTFLDFRNNKTGSQATMSLAWGTPRGFSPFDANDPADGKVHLRPIIEFDISDVDVVDSVKLWVYAYDAILGGADANVVVYRGTDQFEEAAITWFDKATSVQWMTPGGDYDVNTSASGSIPGTGWHEIDVTSLYNAAVTAGQDYLSLVITRAAETGKMIHLATKEKDSGAYTAELWIDTVPETGYDLTVVSGLGTGSYSTGEVANIDATVPAGMDFVAWVGDITDVANTASESTTITMNADYTVTATFAEFLNGDLNEDLNVNITDLNMVLIDWGKSGGFVDANSDGNEDGTIDIVDLNLVLIDWGKTGYKP